MKEIYVGFHAPYFSKDGWPHPQGWFGHCEVWGYEDDTWTFIDPQAKGLFVRSYFKHDDVLAQLDARFTMCQSILRIEAREVSFRFPPMLPMTCAAVCGALIGIRALRPHGLRRKLLLLGAEIIHDDTQATLNLGRAEGVARA